MKQILLIIGALIFMGAIVDFICLRNKNKAKLASLQAQLDRLESEYGDTSKSIDDLSGSINKRLKDYQHSLVNLKQYTEQLENISNSLLQHHNAISQKISIIADFFEDETLDETAKMKKIKQYILLVQKDIELNNELAETLEQQRGYDDELTL